MFRVFFPLTLKNVDVPLPLQWHVAMETGAQGSRYRHEDMFSSGLRELVRLGKLEGRNKGVTLLSALGLYQVWHGSPGRSVGPSPLSVTSVNESGYANENGQGQCHGREQ